MHAAVTVTETYLRSPGLRKILRRCVVSKEELIKVDTVRRSDTIKLNTKKKELNGEG